MSRLSVEDGAVADRKPWRLFVTLTDHYGMPMKEIDLIRVEPTGKVTIHSDIAKQIAEAMLAAITPQG